MDPAVSIRHVKQGEATHCAGCEPFDTVCTGVVGAKSCVAHRCPEHAAAPPINSDGPEQSECAMCVALAIAKGYEKAFESKVFNPVVNSARDRLNLLAHGAGDAFVEEARAILNTAGLGE